MKHLGRYRLDGLLGVGGMARVHRAINDGPNGFSRIVAIKEILPELAHDRAFVEAFLAEARLVARLHHRAIVGVIELGADGASFFFAMEYLDGPDLGRVLTACRRARRQPPPGCAVYIVSEIAAALDYAHRATDEFGRPLGIIHRDVNPANVIVGHNGSVKLIDFGIAKAALALSDEKTRTGILKGKCGYFAPEQVRDGFVGPRSDLFSLGVLFHECLTGQRLFDSLDPLDLSAQVLDAPIPPPSLAAPGLPPALDAIVLKMLARDPERRYGSAAEVCAALAPLVSDLGQSAPQVAQWLVELEPQLAARPSERVPPRAIPAPRRTIRHVTKPQRRHWWLAPPCAAAAVLLALHARHADGPPATARAIVAPAAAAPTTVPPVKIGPENMAPATARAIVAPGAAAPTSIPPAASEHMAPSLAPPPPREVKRATHRRRPRSADAARLPDVAVEPPDIRSPFAEPRNK